MCLGRAARVHVEVIFHHGGPGDWAQVLRLGSRYLSNTQQCWVFAELSFMKYNNKNTAAFVSFPTSLSSIGQQCCYLYVGDPVSEMLRPEQWALKTIPCSLCLTVISPLRVGCHHVCHWYLCVHVLTFPSKCHRAWICSVASSASCFLWHKHIGLTYKLWHQRSCWPGRVEETAWLLSITVTSRLNFLLQSLILIFPS